MKKGMLSPEKVVDISGIKELKEIRENGDNIILGSLVTHAQVVNSEPANSYLPLLVQGCRTVGSPQIRNTGTLGGNIANASPAADSLPPLIALGARIVLSSVNGEREMQIEEFITSPGKTTIKPDEILTKIIVKKMKPGEKCSYRKLGQRKALAISIASVAVRFEFDPHTRRCSNPGIAFGAVAPVIRRARGLEDELAQCRIDNNVIKKIVAKAKEYCDPISDIRASGEYRRDMCCSLLYETLYELTC
jgi:xanthine dehydrogenase FAD-binding subunit